MPKNSVADWDATAANNTDVGGINIAENCAAANINNAIREVMAQVRTLNPLGSSAIGSTVQAYDAGLASIAGLTTEADRMIYTTAADTYAVATLTAAGRALLDDADAAAQRTTLGLGTAAVLNQGTGGSDLADNDRVSALIAAAPSASVATSGQYALTAGGLIEWTHGLGGVPFAAFGKLVNVSGGDVAGWANGEGPEVLLAGTDAGSRANSIELTSTLVRVRLTNTSVAFSIGNKTTGAATGIVNTQWEIILRAVRFA